MPHLSWMQPERYSDGAEIRRALARLRDEGRLGPGPMTYAAPRKPVEELYDSRADPDQMNNLANDPRHRDALDRLRAALDAWMLETRDLGFLPEPDAWRRVETATPYGLARDPIPLPRIVGAARLVGDPDALAEQVASLGDDDPAVRYWAAVGLHAAGPIDDEAEAALRRALDDPAVSVRIEAAAALADRGAIGDALPTLVGRSIASAPMRSSGRRGPWSCSARRRGRRHRRCGGARAGRRARPSRAPTPAGCSSASPPRRRRSGSAAVDG